ncbi:mobile mystery protein A [Oleispirillum naphthae]|uniref:mobile mystery protein A n=1 Tax=Oleispirillum naphthae TaxID=2838853 RepID=UPI0030824586
MGLRQLVQRQYRMLVEAAAERASGVETPPEGWLRTVRKALGMSGAQMAARLGVTRARVAQAEAAEVSGRVTLRTMWEMADALDCRLVYALVPRQPIDQIILVQARRKARSLVKNAGLHMALESQGLSSRQSSDEEERLARELAIAMPSDFWKDDPHG